MPKIIITAIKAELAEARKQVSALEAALAALTGVGVSSEVAQAKPGDRMPDGTVYVGISPNSGRPLYAMPADLPGYHDWQGAQTAATAQTFAGHTDWRLPTKQELNMLYCLREAIGGFKRDYYGSSSEWKQDFTNSHQGCYDFNVCVRCVRTG
jgi:hypothetical protein